MQENRSFTNADDARLISLIGAAKSRVVFVAPGLRRGVAQALADAFRRLPGQVSIILDADAEVCRLGFGDDAGMESVMQAAELHGQRILHQPGVRIGLLIADEDTLIYSPVPLLIEAGSTQPEKPNAIMLKGAVPAAIEAACGISAKRDELREVGLEFVKEAKLAEVKADLAASPPREFNIARIERVFNSAIHFIELEITGYRLKAKKIKLDVELFGMGDSFLKERVENTFKPFDDAAFLMVEIPTLEVRNNLVLEERGQRKGVRRRFLTSSPSARVCVAGRGS